MMEYWKKGKIEEKELRNCVSVSSQTDRTENIAYLKFQRKIESKC